MALEVLKRGGIILYPTDTVWGIGCDAANAEAVDRIYTLKQSRDKKGMIILLDDINKVSVYASKAHLYAFELFEITDKPLTLILPGAQNIASNLVAEDDTVGIRIPHHAFCKELIRQLKKPLVSTSANISGQPTPLFFEDISPQIREGVDHIVGKSMEGAMTRTPSGIIKLGAGGQVEVIRK